MSEPQEQRVGPSLLHAAYHWWRVLQLMQQAREHNLPMSEPRPVDESGKLREFWEFLPVTAPPAAPPGGD